MCIRLIRQDCQKHTRGEAADALGHLHDLSRVLYLSCLRMYLAEGLT